MEIIFHERMPEFSIKMPGDKEGTAQKVKIKKPTGNNKRTVLKLSDIPEGSKLMDRSESENVSDNNV